MVTLIEKLSNISDSTDLWGTLNTVSEALGSMLGVVSQLIGNVTNSSITNDDYTATVSTWLLRQAPLGVERELEMRASATREGEGRG